MQKILIIVGPTSSGKSVLAVELARKFDGEIISADSRQVYRGLDIGTGKITKKEMCGIRHHLLDVASPKRTFTAHDFVKKAHAAIEEIAAHGKLPIIAGGTGFYSDALVGKIDVPDVPIDKQLRERLEKFPVETLFAQLQKEDPARATMIEPHHQRRIIRALEIARYQKQNQEAAAASPPPHFNPLWLGIAPPFPLLEKKIVERLHSRIRSGMIAEARRLHASGLSLRRMETLGLEYRWLARLLKQEISRDEFEIGLARDIRRYAKRQITYWKRNDAIQWFDPADDRKIAQTVDVWLRE